MAKCASTIELSILCCRIWQPAAEAAPAMQGATAPPCSARPHKIAPQKYNLEVQVGLCVQTDFLSIPSPVRGGAPVRTRSHGDDVSALDGVPSAPAAPFAGAHAEAVEPRSKSETDLGEKLAAVQQSPPSDSIAMNPNDARAIEREVQTVPHCHLPASESSLTWIHAQHQFPSGQQQFPC